MAISKGTLRILIKEMHGISLSDKDLGIIVPIVESQLDGLLKLESLNTQKTSPAQVFRADSSR
jgi:hypothetical protein